MFLLVLLLRLCNNNLKSRNTPTTYSEPEVAPNKYLEFLELGGKLRFEVLTAGLIKNFLSRSLPIIAGLSAIYLYNCGREYTDGNTLLYEDIRGESTGHFAVLTGYDKKLRNVFIADPLMQNDPAMKWWTLG